MRRSIAGDMGGRPSRVPAARALQTRGYPFGNQRALKLREHPQHLEEHAPRRRRRVEMLLVQIQVDVERLQVVEECHKVGQGPPKPVKAPGGNRVKLA